MRTKRETGGEPPVWGCGLCACRGVMMPDSGQHRFVVLLYAAAMLCG